MTLRRCGPRALQIRYRPSVVEPLALLAAIQRLGASDCERVDLQCWLGQWRTSFVGCPNDAILYLTGLTAAAQSTRQRHFQARRYALGSVATDAAFAPIQRAWRAARGVKHPDLIEAVREASRGRYLEILPQQGAARLVVDVVGDGYSLFGNGWKSVAVGGRFEDMPDYEYAQWAALGYREVFRSGEPIFEEITAAVRFLRSGRLLLSYRRVILPIGGGEHPDLLLGATLSQHVVRLDREPVDKFGDVAE